MFKAVIDRKVRRKTPMMKRLNSLPVQVKSDPELLLTFCSNFASISYRSSVTRHCSKETWYRSPLVRH